MTIQKGPVHLLESRSIRFPAVKSLDTFDFPAIPSVNKSLVMELARCEYMERRENVIAVGNSGTGKTHIALGLGVAACQQGMSINSCTTAAESAPRPGARVDGGQRRETAAQPAGPAHPPRPHPGDERRQLLPQAQQGERCLASTGRSRPRIGRTVNAVSSYSSNAATLPDLLPSVITSVVHDSAAPAAQLPTALDR